MMKRSQINTTINEAIAFCKKMNFILPPFSQWSPKEWDTKGHEYDEIRDNGLGWDVTDFGSGNFKKEGLTLFTLRNGNAKNPKYIKTYCEKLLLVEEEQVTPYHFHFNKMEDIINRGGGNLLCRVCNATEDEKLVNTPVKVMTDGRHYTVSAGDIVTLRPGESITFPPRMYHEFWAEKETVLAIEVSKLNDDVTDNRFLNAKRFPGITEDENPLYLLCNEYPKAD
jgi:D-lyxose ketol-isomerase